MSNQRAIALNPPAPEFTDSLSSWSAGPTNPMSSLRRAGGFEGVARDTETPVICANGSAPGRHFRDCFEGNVLLARLETGDVAVAPRVIIGASFFCRKLLTIAQIASSLAITVAAAGLQGAVTGLRNMPLLFTLFTITATLQAATKDTPPEDTQRNTANMASTYVPIESWVYPAFDRLASAGFVRSAFVSLRPWTRQDCARLIEEADDLASDPTNSEADTLLRSLHTEFAPELRRLDGASNREARIDSIDLRSTTITGLPVTDGYHFGQTVVSDYGRPFGEGENVYTGVSLRAAAGPFAAYVRAELQRVPSAPIPDSTAQQAIAVADFTPLAAEGPVSDFTRGRLLDANVSFAFHNNELTFGRQSLWWGPGRSGPLLFSNNAEPLMMLRYDRLRPFELPGFLKRLGPIRTQFFVGRLSGQQYDHTADGTVGIPGISLRNQPFLNGQKFSFKPTPNLEFSVSRTVIFGGPGSPVTASTFLRSLFSTGNGTGKKDPGDRRSAFDLQYRVPRLRTCLTAYVDTFTDDEPFPLAYPTESAWSPGLWLTCVPRLPHVTLRAEGLLTPHRDLFPGFFYFNVHYLSGYTNNRQLLGSWIGRQGDGAQVWGTWGLSPRSSVEASVRCMTASSEFLRGGSLRDLNLAADLSLHPEWQLRVIAQFERWRYPLLSASPIHNTTSTVQLSYRPAPKTR